MARTLSRKTVLWTADHALLLLGAAALAFGMGRPAIAAFGGFLLLLAGLASFAVAHGYHLPRPGRTRIETLGCWDVPLTFLARRHGRSYLFWREFESATGSLPNAYEVFGLEPGGVDAARAWEHCVGEGRRLGTVAADALRFDHKRGPYVDTASLARALDRLGAEP